MLLALLQAMPAASRCQAGREFSVEQDFQALQIDYYYGSLHPRLRMSEFDRQIAVQNVEADPRADGSSTRNLVALVEERKRINRDLGLCELCWRGETAIPSDGNKCTQWYWDYDTHFGLCDWKVGGDVSKREMISWLQYHTSHQFQVANTFGRKTKLARLIELRRRWEDENWRL